MAYLEYEMSKRAPPVHCLHSVENGVGESAVWSSRDGRLWWVDLIRRRIHSCGANGENPAVWNLTDMPTSIAPAVSGGFVLGLSRTVARWEPGELPISFATPEPRAPLNRLNEGRVGPDGAYWVGTMQNNVSDTGEPLDITENSGAIYRVTAAGQVTAMTEPGFGITNTFIWLDDQRFVTADTLRNELYSYSVQPDGTLSSDRDLFGSAFPRGLPDGSCLDEEGYIWNCRVVGGGCVVRLSPDGDVDRVIDLPCSWPTSCAFGGADLSTLFITSARFTMSAEHLKAFPLEGALFSVRPGVRGRAEPLFADS